MKNDDIRHLLEHSEAEIQSIGKSINEGEVNKISVKNTLENLRSVLDYLAKDILIKLKSNPKNRTLPEKIYFPYGQKENHFKNSISRNLPPLNAR